MSDDQIAEAVTTVGNRGTARGSDAVYQAAVLDVEAPVLRLEAGGVSGRDRSSRPRTLALAGAAAVVVLLIGVVWAGRSDEGAPVLSGPAVEEAAWLGPALLAPTGVDWSVGSWSHGAEHGSERGGTYTENFTYEGFDLSLTVVGTGGPGATEGWYTGTNITKQIGDRSVEFELVDGGDPSTQPIYQMGWYEPDGSYAMVGLAMNLYKNPGGVLPESGRPPLAVATALAATIAEVPVSEFTAALMPAEGAVDPESGATHRPLRLGLPADEADTWMTLNPWTFSVADINVLDRDTHVALRSWSEPAGFEFQPTSAQNSPVTVRGVDGWIESAGYSPGTPYITAIAPSVNQVTSALVWDEGNARMSLEYPPSVSDDEAITLANSLVTLDDAQWEELLVPAYLFGDPASVATATTETITTDDTTTAGEADAPQPDVIDLRSDGTLEIVPLDQAPDGIVPVSAALNATDANGNPVSFGVEGREPKTLLAWYTGFHMTDASGQDSQGPKGRLVWVVYFDGLTEDQMPHSTPFGPPDSADGPSTTTTVAPPSVPGMAMHVVDAFTGQSQFMLYEAQPAGLPG